MGRRLHRDSIPVLRSTTGYAAGVRVVRDWFRDLVSLHGTPVGIAGGFTLGIACSLVPIPVAGMLLALAMAPLLRCNLPATYFGSAVVNPFTGPIIYFAELWVGLRLSGRPLPEWQALRTLDTVGWWRVFTDMVGPFLVGATAMMLATCALTFPLLWWATRHWQRNHPPQSRYEGTVADPAPATASPAGDSQSND